MSWSLVRRICAVIACLAAVGQVLAASPTLRLELKPSPLAESSTAVLVVTVDTPSPIPTATLEVVVPPGFTADPRTVTFGPITTHSVK